MSSETPPVTSTFTRLRNYFLTGLIITAPLFITAYLIWSFMGWVDSWVMPYIPKAYNPETYLPYTVPGVGSDRRDHLHHADRLPDGELHRPHHRRLRRASGRAHAALCATSITA